MSLRNWTHVADGLTAGRSCIQISLFYKPYLYEEAENTFVFLSKQLITILKLGPIHEQMAIGTKIKSRS